MEDEELEEIRTEDLIIPCPNCGRDARVFLIVDGCCDQCRAEAEREIVVPPTLGWPEVNQRRLLLLVASDPTQTLDRPEAVRNAFTPWRQALRDVTAAESPEAAWSLIDNLEATRPSEDASAY